MCASPPVYAADRSASPVLPVTMLSDPQCVLTHCYATEGVWSHMCASIFSRVFGVRFEEAL